MNTSPLFINKFQEGSAQNANIGFGVMVGVDTQGIQGVVRPSKISEKVSGSVVTDMPTYFTAKDDDEYFCLDENGNVYKSTDAGESWSTVSGTTTTSSSGNGLQWFEGYLFDFRNTIIDYWNGASWTASWKTGLTNADHYTFVYPSAYGFYFANGNKLGFIGKVDANTTFNPGGTIGTDYLYTDNVFELPDLYTIHCMAFLSPNYLALGTGSKLNATVADIILWDTITKNKFEPPLRLFSRAYEGQNGVRQLINRNNSLYAVTGGSHSLFETNGTTFREIENISEVVKYRNSSLNETPVQVFLHPKAGAIEVIGNKLFTGVSSRSGVPSGTPSGYGPYPMGVWSAAFTNDAEIVTCEHVLSTGQTIAEGSVNPIRIGAIKATTQGRLLIGWETGTAVGIDLINAFNYQTNAANTAIESPMFEIGTPLVPEVISNIEINLVRKLLTNQTILVYYRTGFDQDYTLLQTFTGDGTSTKYSITENPIGETQYLQMLIREATVAGQEKQSVDLRNVIIS